jgi:hypothetical protein
VESCWAKVGPILVEGILDYAGTVSPKEYRVDKCNMRVYVSVFEEGGGVGVGRGCEFRSRRYSPRISSIGSGPVLGAFLS